MLLHTKVSPRAARRRAQDLLVRVGIPADRLDQYPHQMSGGQRQRVLIALALACDPQLLIADEPTTALDVMVQAQVLALLEELQREKHLALLFITHDLSVLTHTCQRLAVMYAGRIVEEGPSELVFTDPQHPVLAGVGRGVPHHRRPVVADEPAGPGRRPARSAVAAVGLSVPPRCAVATPECSHARRRAARRRRRSHAPPACTWGPRMSDLDADRCCRCTNVQVQFGGGRVRAVDTVSLEVGRGEVLALVGESGCGKTTLIRSIIGLEPLADGHHHGRGRDGHGQRRRSACPAPQGADDLPGPVGCAEPAALHLRVGRRGPAHPQGEGPRAARWWPRRWPRRACARPSGSCGRFPHEVSGGQRQRVLIAGAMALQPRAAAGRRAGRQPRCVHPWRDPGADAQLRRPRRRVSIIAVTHDLGLAWNIADRVAVMYLGRIVEIGPAEDVLRAPQHPYTQALLSVVPEIEGMEQQILTGETPDPSRMPAGCRFHPRCPLVASGEAERLGIVDKCRGVDLELEPEAGRPPSRLPRRATHHRT